MVLGSWFQIRKFRIESGEDNFLFVKLPRVLHSFPKGILDSTQLYMICLFLLIVCISIQVCQSECNYACNFSLSPGNGSFAFLHSVEVIIVLVSKKKN